MSKNVVIVGAGVIGLSCAYHLVTEKSYPGSKITIVATDFPSTGALKPEYTSSKSGAHFRPFPSKSKEEFRDSKLARSTYHYFKTLVVSRPDVPVKWVEGIDFIQRNDPLYEKLAPGYLEEIEDVRIIPKDELPQGVKFGASYKTWIMNSPLYIEFLEKELRSKYKVLFKHATFGSLEEVAKEFPRHLILNCTGMGLQFSGGYDKDCFPIRGQTLLVRPPHEFNPEEKTITYQFNDAWMFVIPRPFNGGTIIGGTKQINSTFPEPSEKDTEHLINLAKRTFPDLFKDEELQIERINVGFRPARKGGAKIEKYITSSGVEVVDCYGFGGSGMEMSWGAAEKAVSLFLSEPKL